MLLYRSCVGEIKAQMAEHTPARQRLPLSTPAGTRRAKLAPGVVLEWPLHLQTRPVWVLGVWDKAMYQLPRDAPCPVISVLEAWAALSLCHSSLSLRKQRDHCPLLMGTEEWEERRWKAFLKHGKRNVSSWLPRKLGMDNKHLDGLSCPLALVACNLCEKKHYLVQIPEWEKKSERICTRASQQRGYRESREMALPEVLPKNGNELPWKNGQCRVKHLGRQDLAWRILWNSRAHTIPGLSLLPAPCWNLSVILSVVLSPSRHLTRNCSLCVLPLCTLWGFIQHIMYYFHHSNSFWCIWLEKVT